MHVISRKKLRAFWGIHPEAKSPLDSWFRIAKRTDWNTFAEIRAVFRSADQVGKSIVFNIGGNKYRLIAEINYRRQKLFVRHVLTHADYSREAWKDPGILVEKKPNNGTISDAQEGTGSD
jgi:mRNA interferase HigB